MAKEVYDFSEILSEILKDNNLTQTVFGDKIGVKQAQVSEWLNGKAKPGYDNLRAIVKEIGISPEYLLGLED